MPKLAPTPLPNSVLLRDVIEADLPIFFDYQLDPAANRMAAFTAKDPTDRVAFMAHWTKILSDETILLASIRVLQKCGFAVYGEDKEFSNARDEEVEQFMFKLDH